MRRDFLGLNALLHNFTGNESSEEFLAALNELSGRLAGALGELGAQLDETVYPFDHASGDMNLGEYVTGTDVLDENEVGRLYEVVEQCLTRLDAVYLRVLGRLTEIAVRVETAVGLARRTSD